MIPFITKYFYLRSRLAKERVSLNEEPHKNVQQQDLIKATRRHWGDEGK
jgi:hypothetical protein